MVIGLGKRLFLTIADVVHSLVIIQTVTNNEIMFSLHGVYGIHDYSRVNDDVAAQQATNAKLKARNDQLFAEIDDLNGGQEAIEERARNELSMTKPGETFYRLVPDASKRAQTAGQNNR